VLELRRAYWEAYFAGMKADPGCVEFLKMIRGRGVRSAWVSNYATERQILKLNALGLDGLADFLVTSEEAGGEKPDPAPFMLALEKLGKKPEECWMVGDDPGDDVEASIRLGLQGIWFFRDGSTPPGGKTFETVKDWHQLTEIFEKCGKMATAMK
jgi:putative hydrolase of the HAD superfamily